MDVDTQKLALIMALGCTAIFALGMYVGWKQRDDQAKREEEKRQALEREGRRASKTDRRTTNIARRVVNYLSQWDHEFKVANYWVCATDGSRLFQRISCQRLGKADSTLVTVCVIEVDMRAPGGAEIRCWKIGSAEELHLPDPETAVNQVDKLIGDFLVDYMNRLK